MKMRRLGCIWKMWGKILASQVTCLSVIQWEWRSRWNTGHGVIPHACGVGQVSASGFIHLHLGEIRVNLLAWWIELRDLVKGKQWDFNSREAGCAGNWWAGSERLVRAAAGSGASTLIWRAGPEICVIGGGGGKWISVCRAVTTLLLLNVVKLERLLI